MEHATDAGYDGNATQQLHAKAKQGMAKRLEPHEELSESSAVAVSTDNNAVD